MPQETLERSSRKIVRLRRPDVCTCGTSLARRERAMWDWELRAVLCLECGRKPAVVTPPPRVAAWPVRPHADVFGTRLAPLGASVAQLRELRVPGSDVTVEHVLVGAGGVLVVDTHRCRSARVTAARGGGLLRARRDLLLVGGEDETERIETLAWKADAVRHALAGTAWAATRVTAVLCVLDAALPLLRPLEVAGTPILAPAGVARLATADGPHGPSDREAIAGVIADELPASIVTSRKRRRAPVAS